MLSLSRWLIGLLASALVAAIAPPPAEAIVVNIDARSAAVVVPLGAGRYRITPVDSSTGGTFTAWNAWGGSVSGCQAGGGGCVEGWLSAYRLSSPSLGTRSFGADNFGTAALAFANGGGTTFTLAAAESVSFFVPDNILWDNVGGVSLEITPIEPLTLRPGDIVVADNGGTGPGGPGRILRIDPVSGVQDVVSWGGSLVDPNDLALEASGTIVAVDPGARAVIRVNPTDGAQTVLSSGGLFVTPVGISLDGGGAILVTDFGGSGWNGGVIRVDPVTGAQSWISTGGSWVDPTHAVVERTSGKLLVVDANDGWGGPVVASGALVRVDPVSGDRALVVNGGLFVHPERIALGSPGYAYITERPIDGGTPRVLRVDLANGAQAIVSSGGRLVDPAGIAVEPSGSILIVDYGARQIVRIDPRDGTQALVSENRAVQGWNLQFPSGIAVVPSPGIKAGEFSLDLVCPATARAGAAVTMRVTLENATRVDRSVTAALVGFHAGQLRLTGPVAVSLAAPVVAGTPAAADCLTCPLAITPTRVSREVRVAMPSAPPGSIVTLGAAVLGTVGGRSKRKVLAASSCAIETVR